jgi:hypothetical protein
MLPCFVLHFGYWVGVGELLTGNIGSLRELLAATKSTSRSLRTYTSIQNIILLVVGCWGWGWQLSAARPLLPAAAAAAAAWA